MPQDDLETPHGLSMSRGDSRILEMPLIQRSDSAFTLLNPADELAMARIWSSFNTSLSRPATVHGDASKLLVKSEIEVEEKKETITTVVNEAKQVDMSSSLADIVTRTLFTKTETGTSKAEDSNGTKKT